MFEIIKLNKKYLSLVLAASVFIFSGCGEGDDGKTGATTVASNGAASNADTTPPTGSVYINSTAQNNATNSTSVTLNMSASDASGVSQMCVSNTTACTSWETYATSKAWSLPAGDGVKIVYIWFKDAVGNASATPYSGSITLDTTPPVDGTFTATAVSGTIKLDWSNFSDTGSGRKDFILVYSVGGGAAPSSCATGTAVPNFIPNWVSGTSYTFTQTTGLTSGTTTYYRLCATDWAGNTSAGAVAQATP